MDLFGRTLHATSLPSHRSSAHPLTAHRSSSHLSALILSPLILSSSHRSSAHPLTAHPLILSPLILSSAHRSPLILSPLILSSAHRFLNSQNATLAAAATLSESTPYAMGILTTKSAALIVSPGKPSPSVPIMMARRSC